MAFENPVGKIVLIIHSHINSYGNVGMVRLFYLVFPG